MTEKQIARDANGPSGGWGSLKAVTGILFKEYAVLASRAICFSVMAIPAKDDLTG
jgi:hypothetical protein